MTAITIALSYLAISQLLFLCSCVLLHFRKNLISQLLLLFSLCMMGYLLLITTHFDGNLIAVQILSALAVSTPAVLWVLATLLFNDNSQVPRPALALIGLYIATRCAGNFLQSQGVDSTALTLVSFLFPLLAMLGLSVHAIYLGIAGRSDDLVEERRIVRVPFVISMGIFVAVVLASSAATTTSIIPDAASLEPFFQYRRLILALYALGVALALNLALCTLKPGAVALLSETTDTPPRRRTLVKPVSKQDLKVIQRLQKAIEEDRIYMQEGLTIAALARTISAPEYKLRRLINRQMQFRNFNQFVNTYRIREAGRLLAETEEPISNIALMTGFASLSSFNQVFKEIHGVPPREYRMDARGQPASAAP